MSQRPSTGGEFPHEGSEQGRHVPTPGQLGDGDPQGDSIRRSARGFKWRPFHTGLVVGALIAVAVTLLIIQNGHSARVSWLFFHFKSPQWIILFITAVAGAIAWQVIRVGFLQARTRLPKGRKTGSPRVNQP